MSALRIERVEVIPVEVPRRGSFALQRGTTPPSSPFTIVRVTTREGIVGYGEATTTDTSMRTVLSDHLAELLPGRDPFDLIGIHGAIDALEMMRVERLGHWNPARAAIDIALHDIQGKSLGIPVSDLIGGRQREAVDVCKNIGVSEMHEAATTAKGFVEAGYRTLKLRVGRDVDDDARRLEGVRAAVGGGVRIRLDANQAWDSGSAVRAIRRLGASGLEAIEQPCAFDDPEAAAFVRERVDVPIIADEGFWTENEASTLLDKRAADALHIYLGKCGGIRNAMRIAALAEVHNAAVTVGERVPLGIGLAAHLHVAAALRTSPFAHALAYDLNEDDLLTASIEVTDGAMPVPTGPGLGVEIDEERVDFYARH